MSAPPTLSAEELQALTDPAELLERAWALEPPMRLVERTATLDRLEALLAGDSPPATVPGREWALELTAERAIDGAISTEGCTAETLAAAMALADRVLENADPSHTIAIARATFARGRAMAWIGTDEATRQADGVLIEAAERYRDLGRTDWHGFATFWRGYGVYFQNGNLPLAAELEGRALEILAPDSPRRANVLDFYADVLLELGEWDGAESALAEAEALARRHGDRKDLSFMAWTRAHIVAARGDALAAERLLREVEREAEDWFDTHIGVAFLTDAAEVLDRVGLTEQAQEYLARAVERLGFDDEAVLQASATLLARTGDPAQALAALQELTRGDWLEKRYIWRFTLLSAWATFRAGREGSGELAARALRQAIGCGGIRVALAGEPDLVAALAPLAEQAGSADARELLLEGRPLLVRLFGTPAVARADGTVVELPAGKPGELVRLLALHEHGLAVEVVLELFFPDAPPTAARQRLRQVLTRLRAAAGEIVVRDGEHLRLLPAWVDVRAFLATAGRVRTSGGSRAVTFAYAALALHTGPLLPTDRYAEWADDIREEVGYRHVALLEQIAEAARARGSHEEALTAFEAALREAPDDPGYRAAVAGELTALGRPGAADRVAGRRGAD